jgi:hypothetical protein
MNCFTVRALYQMLCDELFPRRLRLIKSSRVTSRRFGLLKTSDVSGTICPHHQGIDVTTVLCVQVTLQLTVSQPVCLGVEPLLGLMTTF